VADALHNRLRELIDRQPSALGTFITLGDPVAVELAGLAVSSSLRSSASA
jgi:hypothetical protein